MTAFRDSPETKLAKRRVAAVVALKNRRFSGQVRYLPFGERDEFALPVTSLVDNLTFASRNRCVLRMTSENGGRPYEVHGFGESSLGPFCIGPLSPYPDSPKTSVTVWIDKEQMQLVDEDAEFPRLLVEGCWREEDSRGRTKVWFFYGLLVSSQMVD